MLFKKLMRDMRAHKTQFISIFLMAFLSVYVYSGIGGEWAGLQHSGDSFYKETKMADAFVYGDDFSKDDLTEIKNIPDVNDAERRLDIPAVLDTSDEPSVRLHFLEENTVSKPYITDGAAIDLRDKKGVWVDQRFAGSRGLKIGDKITFNFGDMELTKNIRGLIYSPEYVFRSESEDMVPDFKHNGFAYMSSEAFPVKEMLAFNTILIRSDEDDALRFESSVEKALDSDYVLFTPRKDHPSVKTFNSEIRQHKMMSDIFPVVFFLIALLTIMTTMTRIVANQRTQIGTLKALGFTKAKITRHYISYGLFLSFAGAALGLAAGPSTLPYLFYPSMSSFYTLPDWQPYFKYSFAAVAVILIICCTMITYLACRKILKDNPAETLRPASPKKIKHRKAESSALWKYLSFNVRWNLRDIWRNKSRSLMAIIGVFGCTALLSCAFGMNDGLKDLKSWQYDDLIKYETKISLDENITKKQEDKIIEETGGERFYEASVELKSSENKKSGTLTVLDDNDLIKVSSPELDIIALPKEGVSMTEKMAELLSIKKGDVIKWHIIGEKGWETSEVANIHREPLTQGIVMTRSYFEKEGYKYEPTAILTDEKVTKSPDGASSTTSKNDSLKGWDELTESMMLMVYILIGGAVVLAVVVLYNLSLLSFTEKERDLATLKVLGFKTGRLRNLLLTQNIWFSVIGFILGIPAGFKLLDTIVSMSGDSFDYPITPHGKNLLYCFLITFGLSIFTNLLFSGKIKKIDMVEALKSSE